MLTPYHAKYFAHDLTRRAATGMDRLSMSLFDAAVDLNPHQIEAALFALAVAAFQGRDAGRRSRPRQDHRSRNRALPVLGRAQTPAPRDLPASLRKQWALELEEKFNLPARVLDAKAYREAQRAGRAPLDREGVS